MDFGMHHEYEDIGDEGRVMQGDVVMWHDKAYGRPWRTYGVVVTADCDLEWRKHGDKISFVPALSTEDYLWHHWVPNQYKTERDSSVATLARRINRWLEKRSPPQALLSEDAVSDWIVRVGREVILDELGLVDKGERNNLVPHIDKALALISLMSTAKPDIAKLRSCNSLIKPNQDNDDKFLAADFQKAISQLPGDVFHLPVLHDRDDEGLFLMLRHISQCETADIALTPDEIRFGEAKAKRVARITAPYRYAITQNLARIFADIGLPKEHEDRCKSSAARFFASRKNE